MRNFSSYLLVAFMIMFWGFRVIVAVCAQLNWSFGGFEPINLQLEIILLFVFLICLVLVIKRKIAGGLIYLLSYGLYCLTDITENAAKLLNPTEGQPILTVYSNLMVSIIALILAVAVLMDLLMDKNRKAHPKDKKTDWFYTNEQFDREFDERADKNNYRTL